MRISEEIFRLVPPCGLSESDRFEVRFQFIPEESGPCNVNFYLDAEKPENGFFRQTVQLTAGKAVLVKSLCSLAGRAGEHRIIVEISAGKERKSCSRNFHVAPGKALLLNGGFLTLGLPDRPGATHEERTLTDEMISAKMTSWSALGFQLLVVTSTYQPLSLTDRNDLRAFYPSRNLPMMPGLASSDPLGTVLKTAEKLGQYVFIGLGHFQETDKMSLLMRELYENYGHFTSFYGWYASYEFSTAWGDFHATEQYFSRLKEAIGQLAPVLPLMASPYLESLQLNADPETDFRSPKSLEDNAVRGVHPAFMDFLEHSPARPDILMPQDNLGGLRHGVTVGKSARVFSVFRETAERAGIHLWANCESFDFRNGKLVPRFLNGGFDGEAGFVQQMEAVAPYADRILTYELTRLFAAPGVIPELGGPDAVAFYQSYECYRKHPRFRYRNLAHGKRYTISAPPFSILEDGTEFKATDGRLTGGFTHPIDDSRLIGFVPHQAGGEEYHFSVAFLIDLEKTERIDRIRFAAAWRKIAGQPDRIQVHAGEDETHLRPLGETDSFLNGYALIEAEQPFEARFVKVVFEKLLTSDVFVSWQNCWLLIDEIEVLKKEVF